MKPKDKVRGLGRLLHNWYLDITAQLHPESYNPEAQKGYDDLTEEQQKIDLYIAEKTLEWAKGQVDEGEIRKLMKLGEYWNINKNDVGRELFVIPMGKKAIDIASKAIAEAIRKKYEDT